MCIICLLALLRTQIMASMPHIPSWYILITTNTQLWQIAQPSLPSLLPSHLQLGQQHFHNYIYPIIFGSWHVCNLWNKTFPFSH